MVHAAAGGVGLAAVQVAKGMSLSDVKFNKYLNRSSLFLLSAVGAKVIATAGSQEKLDIAKKYGGADYGINYREEGWQAKVKEITNGKGVDVCKKGIHWISRCPC